MRIRECVAIELGDTPERAFEYWKANIPQAPWYDEAKEALVVLILNVRKKIIGHNLVSLGSLDTCLVHAREVFRPVICAAGHSVILMHNHPSGESYPSDADIRITREMARAGELLKIEITDHVIVAGQQYSSLRELGYLFSA